MNAFFVSLKDFSADFNEEEKAHIVNKNVSLANIKFNFTESLLGVEIPLYDPEKPIFSTLDLDVLAENFLKKEQKEALLKVGYKLEKSLEEVKKSFYQLNHSEKAVLGFIYTNSENILKKLLHVRECTCEMHCCKIFFKAKVVQYSLSYKNLLFQGRPLIFPACPPSYP